MPGTRAGGLKASVTNKKRYGKDFYSELGKKGGKATGMKGFALNRDNARRAGQIGGKASRRGKAKSKK